MTAGLDHANTNLFDCASHRPLPVLLKFCNTGSSRRTLQSRLSQHDAEGLCDGLKPHNLLHTPNHSSTPPPQRVIDNPFVFSDTHELVP
jgi:hypothetical protein